MFYIILDKQYFYSEDYHPRKSLYNVTLFDTLEDASLLIVQEKLEDAEIFTLSGTD